MWRTRKGITLSASTPKYQQKNTQTPPSAWSTAKHIWQTAWEDPGIIQWRPWPTTNCFHHLQYDLFLAGTDTSRAFIEWTLIYMATMPEIQEKIYREIQEKIGDRFPKVSDKLSKLKLIHGCAKWWWLWLYVHPIVGGTSLHECRAARGIPSRSRRVLQCTALFLQRLHPRRPPHSEGHSSLCQLWRH